MARPMRKERGVSANSSISQRELIAWLDTQEQKLFLRVAPRNETVEAFDPLHRERGVDDFAIPARIIELYDADERGEQGRLGRRRRTIRWRFHRGLTKPLVPQMLHKIKHSVQTRHKVNLRFAYKLRNIEDNKYTVYYKNTNSHWFSKLSQRTSIWSTKISA